MIRKTTQGYRVVSERGRHLSKPNLTKGQAKKRLAQVEYFKHRDAGKTPPLRRQHEEEMRKRMQFVTGLSKRT